MWILPHRRVDPRLEFCAARYIHFSDGRRDACPVRCNRFVRTDRCSFAATRSCFETVFCFGALHKDPGFLEKFEKHDIYGKRAFAKALPVGELEPDAAEILSQFFDGLDRSGEKGERLKWESVANSVGLGHVAGLPRSKPVSQRCETAPSFSSSQMS